MPENNKDSTPINDEQGGISNSASVIMELMERNFERFPMLEVIFDKFARTFTSIMRNMTSDGISVNIEEITSRRFKDYNPDTSTKLMCIFGTKELDGRGVIFLDRNFLNMMLTILFGGRKVLNTEDKKIADTYSVVDKKVADYLIQNILSAMKKAFDLISEINFFIDRYETNFRFIGITSPSEVVICTTVKIDLEKKSTLMEIVFPKIMLGPIHNKLKKISATDSSTELSKWGEHFRSEVENVEVTLEFAIGKTTMLFRDLMKMHVGSIMMLDGHSQMENIIVRINGEPFFIGEAGKINNQIAIKIKEVLK